MQIPAADWRLVPLKFTVHPPVGGDWGSEPHGDSSDTLCVRVADFDYARGSVHSQIPTVRSIEPARRSARLLQPGDLLLEKSGGGDGQPVGRVVLVRREFERPAVSSNFIARLRPRPGFNPNYLQYVHRSLYSRGLTRPSIKQTTGIQNLDVEHYLSGRAPFPSLELQGRIARFLDDTIAHSEGTIEAKRRLLDLLEEKRRALHAAAAAGLLTSSSERGQRPNLPWLSSIPRDWAVAKLTLVTRLGTGHTPSRSEPAYWEADREIPWLTTGDVESFRSDRIDVLTQTKERVSRLGLDHSAAVLHPQGTVALSRTASVGFSIVMGTDMATSQDFVTWTCSRRLEPRFLLICLRAMRTDLVGRLARGSTHKTIYMSDIESLRIPLPPLREQRDIIAKVEAEGHALSELTDLVNRQIPLLAERRDAVVAAALSEQFDLSLYRRPALVP